MASPRDKGIEPPNPLLLEAITTSTNDRLVEALILLIQRNRQAKELAENYLLVTTSSSSSSTLEDKEQVKDTIEPQDEGNNKEYVPRGTKRVRSGSIEGDVQPSAKRIRFQICAQCEDEYDITENEQNACRWHPGSQRVAFVEVMLTICRREESQRRQRDLD